MTTSAGSRHSDAALGIDPKTGHLTFAALTKSPKFKYAVVIIIAAMVLVIISKK